MGINLGGLILLIGALLIVTLVVVAVLSARRKGSGLAVVLGLILLAGGVVALTLPALMPRSKVVVSHQSVGVGPQQQQTGSPSVGTQANSPAGRASAEDQGIQSQAIRIGGVAVLIILAYLFVDAGHRRYPVVRRVAAAAAFGAICLLLWVNEFRI